MQENLVQEILKILSNNKIKNVEILNISAKSSLIDELVVGTFPSEKNCKIIAKQIKTSLEELCGEEIFMDGEFPGDWVIFDLGKIVVELFSDEKRNYYNLEKLWGSTHIALSQVKGRKKK